MWQPGVHPDFTYVVLVRSEVSHSLSLHKYELSFSESSDSDHNLLEEKVWQSCKMHCVYEVKNQLFESIDSVHLNQTM